MIPSLFVLLGSALGGLARFWIGIWSVAAWGPDFPWGTLLINIGGSFLIGLAGAALPVDAGNARSFVMVGICGGFTTFSSYSLQGLELLRTARFGAASFYLVGSVVACLAATLLGVMAGSGLRST